MLDRLPPEILDAILVLTYPPSPWPDKNDVDRTRRRTLCHLCLTARAVRAQAHSLLWRKVVLGSTRRCDRFLQTAEQRPDLVSSIRTMRTKGIKVLSKILPALPRWLGLRKLQCVGGRVSWEELSGLSVEILELWDVKLTAAVAPRPTRVVRLTLVGVHLIIPDAKHLLQPEVFPQLRSFTFSPLFNVYTNWQLPEIPQLLARQLDLLVVQLVPNTVQLHERIHDLPTCVMVARELFSDVSFPTVLQPYSLQPPHLCILGPPTSSPLRHDASYWDVRFVLTMRTLIDYVRSATPPRSLHLPSFLPSLNPNRFPLTPPERDSLLRWCASTGVEVFWHDASEEQPTFPRAFWEEAKRVKARAVAAEE
ncbi:hypothetical protein JCM8097_005742 [Rhodosporidiobolus ruineniae]